MPLTDFVLCILNFDEAFQYVGGGTGIGSIGIIVEIGKPGLRLVIAISLRVSFPSLRETVRHCRINGVKTSRP